MTPWLPQGVQWVGWLTAGDPGVTDMAVTLPPRAQRALTILSTSILKMLSIAISLSSKDPAVLCMCSSH